MSIKSILCAYSGDTARGSGLAHAIKLAQHHDAHLTGALERGPNLVAARLSAHVPPEYLRTLTEADETRISEVATRFEDAAVAAGLQSRADFVVLNPETDGPLSEFAHGYDLVVTSPHSNNADEAHLSAYPDLIALRSGRPVLIVPDDYSADGLAKRALVAWDGKRASARAVSDAMDILAEKAGVTLLSVGETPRGTDRLVANMERHGIAVEAETVDPIGTVAVTVLTEADARGATLIVMGAFEHSKFNHDVFGGVTTDVIQQARVPVFMAH